MINQIINYVNSQGRFVSQKELIENAFWFTFSSLLGSVQPKVEFKYKLYNINYFGITIAPSSAGKSFVYEQCKKLFGEDLNQKYKNLITKGYKLNTQNPTDDEITIDGFQTNIKNYIPNFENTIEGTKEGLYLRALALSKSFFGSLNLIHEEIMDVIKDSNLNVMKELYDGRFIGKVIKSSINDNIYGVVSNMLIFGSSTSLKRDQKVYEYFAKALGSGIYRRSFIYYQEPTDIQLRTDTEYYEQPDLSFIREYINKHIKEITESGNYPELHFTVDAEEYLELINHELVEFANKYKEDERFSAEVGSFDKLLKLSALHALLNRREQISYDNVEYAYNFYKHVRSTNLELFNVEPQHRRIYRVIKKLGKATKSEILESDIFNRMTFNEDIKLVDEYAYRKNEVLQVRGSKIKTFSIEPMPMVDLNKIIVSIPKVDKKEKTTDYISMEIPFFGENQSVERLVKSDKVSNFCLVHFENGKRKSDKTIEGQNCIGIDVDNGITLQETIEKLKDYVYLIYTTKSHQKDKGGLICDRFRILLPTKSKFFVDNERHKELITNVCEALGVGSYDVSTRNQDRLWFTNPECQTFKNQQGELFDVIPYLPDTEVREIIEKQIEKFDEKDYDTDEVNRRIGGMIKWFINNTYQGNRSNNLFRLGSFIGDLTGSFERIEEELYKANSMLSEPISEKELRKTVLASLKRKYN